MYKDLHTQLILNDLLIEIQAARDTYTTLLEKEQAQDTNITTAGITATWANITGDGKPDDNATVGAIWGTNITNEPTLGDLASLDVIGVAQCDTTLIDGGYIKTTLINTGAIVITDLSGASTFTAADITNLPASPTGTGLFCNASYLGYYTDGAWTSYLKSDGDFRFSGDANNYIAWNGTTLEITGNINVQNASTVRTALNVADGATVGATWGVDINGQPSALVQTFYQALAPTEEMNTGDFWIDSDDNKIYRYDGATWNEVQDNDIATAISNAATAQATADGKVVTFIQAASPTAEGVGDLWFDSDDNNRCYRWSGSAWVEVRDGGIAQAITDAATAQATADGKVTTFYQDTEPTAEGVGDIWFDTDDNNRCYRWSGSAWVDSAFDVATWSKISGTGKPADNATVGADWSSNLSNIPTTLTTADSAGLYLNSGYLGFWDGDSWNVYINDDGDFYLGGDSDNFLSWDGTNFSLRTDGLFRLLDGGDFELIGSDSDPARIYFCKSDDTKRAEIGIDADGENLLISPMVDDAVALYLGGNTTAGPWQAALYKFSQIYGLSKGYINLRSLYSGTTESTYVESELEAQCNHATYGDYIRMRVQHSSSYQAFIEARVTPSNVEQVLLRGNLITTNSNACRIDVGTYTGTGSARDINLSFTPNTFLLGINIFKNSSMSGSYANLNGTQYSNMITIGTNKVTVDTYANSNGTVYYYVALG